MAALARLNLRPIRADNHEVTILGRPILSLFMLLSIVATITTANAPEAAAQATEWSETATLVDGVSGLDISRQTTIEAEVWAIESVGPFMLVGGAFLNVRDRSSYETIPHPYLAAFDPTTGEYVPWFTTQPNGPVYDIIDLGGGRAMIAGEFTAVNDVPNTSGVAIIDTATGEVDTSLAVSLGGSTPPLVRAVAIHNNWLYITGSFTSVSAGGQTASTLNAARIDLNNSRVDPGWNPRLEGGGGWGIDTSSSGRVFIGGYFGSVDGLEDTETLVAVDGDTGAVVTAWNNGFPHDNCLLNWRSTCGAVNGLQVLNDTVFVAGAKHFWAALAASDGELLADKEISNDGQALEIVNGMIAVGCHCSHSNSDEFRGVTDRYIRIIDPNTLTEVASPTVNSEGAAGGWAAGTAPDGCLWSGGNFSSTTVGGTSHPAWSLLRFCPTGGIGTNPVLVAPPSADQQPPATPAAPQITSVSSTTVTLSWPSVADDSGQQFYMVFRNGVPVGRTGSNSYTDRLLPYSSAHEWQVAAIDMSANMSDLSAASTGVAIGPRINLATGAVATQVSDFDATTTADKAIDGDTNGDPLGLSVSRTGDLPEGNHSWIQIDLGQVRSVDQIELHPRTDSAYRESNQRPKIYMSEDPITRVNRAEALDETTRTITEDLAGDTPTVLAPDVSDELRYIRIFQTTSRISFAEIRVFSSNPQPAPAPFPLDTTPPGAPRWKYATSRGDNTVLRWAPAADDVGIAFYEVYNGTDLVWSTTERSAPVGAAGQTASSFTVIAYDAAGNPSSEPPTLSTPIDACTATRTNGTVIVAWSGADDASSFVVRRSVNQGTAFWRGLAPAETTEWIDSDRTGELNYFVEARYPAGNADPVSCTNEVGETPPPTPEIARTEKAKVVVKWAKTNDMLEIERNGAIVGSDDDGWFTDGGLDEGTTYTYRLRIAGTDTWSSPVETTTLESATLDPVASCGFSTNADGDFDVSWELPDGASGAVIERQVNGGSWWWRARVDAPALLHTDTNRPGAVLYQVKAKYPAGTSDPTVCTAN